MRKRVRLGLPALACLALLALAPPALATFHEMSIREVYPGGADNASYVELQMWTAGQNFVGGHHLVAYDANGGVSENFTLPGSVANGANQATILVADTNYPLVFGGKPAPDATDANLNLSPAGGAVCWTEGAPPDCVAWGNFTGPLPAHLPELKAGSPVSPVGVTAGKALRRSITAGCSTLLDPPPTDDSDNSAADFSEGEPNPRNNATAPVEHACPSLPNTVLDTKPANPTKTTSAGFTYHAVPAAEASFECRLDGAVFASCASSGAAYPGPLAEGTHNFEVRAVNMAGADATPAAYTWTVDTTPPAATIKTHPADPSPGASAAFTYQANELNSTFECRLSPTEADFTSCPKTGKTYAGLADGNYAFEVRATDPAGNAEVTAAEFQWTVDNSLADETPPETRILAGPPDPSDSSTASFSYESNEAKSSFECALDTPTFTSCPAGGVTYAGLGSGPHSFQVRAVDPSANKDLSPAGYSFQVVLASTPLPAPAPPPAISTGRPAPQTLFSKPAARTRDRTPTFRFRSATPGTSFQCKLDGGPFRACRSPFTTKVLSYGPHILRIRAVLRGTADPTPAVLRFKVEPA